MGLGLALIAVTIVLVVGSVEQTDKKKREGCKIGCAGYLLVVNKLYVCVSLSVSVTVSVSVCVYNIFIRILCNTKHANARLAFD